MKTVFFKTTLVQSLVLIALLILLMGCNSQKGDYKPEIIYIEGKNVNEVRLILPSSGSKIIYKLQEPIFESGEKCSYTTEIPMSGLNFLESDSSYHLVNTSFAKIGGGGFHIFYIYQKGEKVIIFREYLCISGLGDSEVVFKGNVFNTAEDKVNKYAQSKSMVKENKVVVFVSNYNSNDRVELVFNGDDVILMKYENNMRTMSVKGKFFNNDLIMDDDYYYYKLTGDELCFGAEGVDECFKKEENQIPNSNQIQY